MLFHIHEDFSNPCKAIPSNLTIWFGASGGRYVLYMMILCHLICTIRESYTEFENDSKSCGVRSSLILTGTPPWFCAVLSDCAMVYFRTYTFESSISELRGVSTSAIQRN